MNNFEKWDKAFRAQNLYAFNNDANALAESACRKSRQTDETVLK